MAKTTTPSENFADGQHTTLGVLVHLIGLVFGGQLFGFISSGIVYLLADNKFTKANARNSLNWWLLMFGATIVVLFVAFIVTPGNIFSILTIIAGSFLGLVSIAFSIWATLKANSGEVWEYPLAPKLI